MSRILFPLLSVFIGCGGDVTVVDLPAKDDDDDGYSVDDDCDDHDASVYPGAAEVADDGVDQDCDGVDALTTFGHRDDDGTTTLSPDFIIGNAILLENALEVTHLGFTVRQAFGEVRLAMYSSDGGFPAALLAETAPIAAVQGVNEIPVEVPVVVGDGVEVWLQIVSSEAIPIAAGEEELVMYTELPWSEDFRDPYGVAWDYVGERISLFLTGELPEE